MAASIRASLSLDKPTASGFAMLMRRSAIDRIGVLDGAALTRGYLEEVDWCLRARGAGFTHLLATGVFVAHEGGTSFGAEKRLRVVQNRATIAARYPDYYAEYARFLRDDPMGEARGKLLDALAVSGSGWPASDLGPPEAINPREGLRASHRRFAAWHMRAGSDASQRLLALARHMASQPDSPHRLLVFGDASEALRHTGVVDVVPFARGEDSLLTDSMLASLAGCTELLAGASTPVPAGVPCTRLTRDFDPVEWLSARESHMAPVRFLEAA